MRETEAADPRVDGFRDVYESTYAHVTAYARRRAASSADADDLVAEVYLVAWRRLDEVRQLDHALPWLYAVAWRVHSNQQRSTRRRDALVSRLGSDPTSPSPATAPSDENEQVRQALARLAPRNQEILRLHCWENLNRTEIAAVLGISINAVTVRLHRARKALAAELPRNPPTTAGQNNPDDPPDAP